MGALRSFGIPVAIGVGAVAFLLFAFFHVGGLRTDLDDPLKVCINDIDTPYTITATLELYIDGNKDDVPAGVGFEKGGCQRSLYTLTSDGTIHASWSREYPFEIGHFLWVWDFPLRDMDGDKSRIIVDGREAPESIRAPLVDGSQYVAEFISKPGDDSED